MKFISIPVRYDWNPVGTNVDCVCVSLGCCGKDTTRIGKKCRCRKIDFGRGYDNCISEGYNVIKELKF